MYALRYQRFQLFDLLLREMSIDADFTARDLQGNTILHYAVVYCADQTHIFDRLIDHFKQLKLDIDQRNHFGFTPLLLGKQQTSGEGRGEWSFFSSGVLRSIRSGSLPVDTNGCVAVRSRKSSIEESSRFHRTRSENQRSIPSDIANVSFHLFTASSLRWCLSVVRRPVSSFNCINVFLIIGNVHRKRTFSK